MPWEETTRMSQRGRFVLDFESCLYTMSELCERYAISRKTGYKWAERYAVEGFEGLRDRSRRAKSCPHRTQKDLEERLVELRRTHPHWGPRKLLAWWQKRSPLEDWPAASTVGDILKRHGLVEPRERARRKWQHPAGAQVVAGRSNEVWSTDFKGQFRTGDRRLCYPLTVADGYSRYLLGLKGQSSVAGELTWPEFERVFREYGLPDRMRMDNGVPFASQAVGGLSYLSLRWIKLGIQLERIEPGHPEQNGRHERMHRVLKAETARPPAADAASQQERFDRFRQEYNEERPHEALAQKAPAELYQPSSRSYPEQIPKPEYPGHFEVRSVHHGGEIKWRGRHLFISEVLHGERVGLEEYDDGLWALYFGTVLLARFDERDPELHG